jgi:hypothetical protein
MDWTAIISELGGGLSAVVIVGLAFWVWTRERRINALTDKFIEQNADNISAMNNLTTAIRERRAPDG